MSISNPICVPTTSVRGRGTISVVAVRQDSATIEDVYADHTETRTNKADVYRFTATPEQGWAFDHFEVETSYDYGVNVGRDTERHETRYESDSFIGDNPLETEGLGEDGRMSASVRTIVRTYSGGRYHGYHETLSYQITAVFVRIPTGLLVNSHSLGSPVRLVYDPATNKLVCDA